MIERYADFDLVSAEEAQMMIEHLSERTKYAEEHGRIPGLRLFFSCKPSEQNTKPTE